MKKVFVCTLAFILIASLLCACGNRQWMDTTYTFNRVVIALPNGEVVDGKVQSWKDFEDGDQIQVKVDGKTYLVHSSNVALIAQ